MWLSFVVPRKVHVYTGVSIRQYLRGLDAESEKNFEKLKIKPCPTNPKSEMPKRHYSYGFGIQTRCIYNISAAPIYTFEHRVKT